MFREQNLNLIREISHQTKAIDFIFRRETGDLPRELSLWEESIDDTGEHVSVPKLRFHESDGVLC